MKFALLVATAQSLRLEQAPAAPAPPAPWYNAQANKNIKKSADMAAWEEGMRVAAVNEVAAENKWRNNGPKTTWGKLAQDEWQPWQQTELDDQHKHTMGIAGFVNDKVKAAVKEQSEADEWRANGKKYPIVKGSLAQEEPKPYPNWQPWQHQDFKNQNGNTNDNNTWINDRRVKGIEDEALANAWRANGQKAAALVQGPEWQPWQQTDYDKQHKHTMGVADFVDSRRVDAIDTQSASDAWRASGKGSLVQDEWQPWQQVELDNQHKHTMGIAGFVNDKVKDAIKEQAEADEWRARSLAQEEPKKWPNATPNWQEWQHKEFDSQNANTNDNNKFINARREQGIKDEALANAWRASGKKMTLVQGPDGIPEWQPWQHSDYDKQHAHTTGISEAINKITADHIDSQEDRDGWRSNGVRLVQGKDEWQPWQQTEFEDQHKYTMGVANQSEKERQEAVEKQETEDVWRNDGPKTPWGKLVQRRVALAQAQEDPWYQKEYLKGEKVVMDRANADEEARVAKIEDQAEADEWRAKGRKPQPWGGANPYGWNPVPVEADKKKAEAKAANPDAEPDAAAPAEAAPVAK